MSFYATTVVVDTSVGATISRCTFNYPSASRRALGGTHAEFNPQLVFGIGTTAQMNSMSNVEIPTTTISGTESLRSVSNFDHNVVFRSEGPGLQLIHAWGDTISNNLIEETGYPFARAVQLWSFLGGQHFFRNTIRKDGAGGIGPVWGSGSVAELNRISESGLLITDSQGIGGGKPTTDTTFQLNWISNNRGLGLRFDAGEDGVFGERNHLVANVAWMNAQGGLAGKANSAFNLRNTVINNQNGFDPELGR